MGASTLQHVVITLFFVSISASSVTAVKRSDGDRGHGAAQHQGYITSLHRKVTSNELESMTELEAAVTNPNTGQAVGSPVQQSWCVARPGASATALQVALDYACGHGGADCSGIQRGGRCFAPDTIRDHASYAFNDYYHNNPIPTSCDFGGTAVITNADPSTPTCPYPSSASSTNNTNGTLSPPPSSTGADSSGYAPAKLVNNNISPCMLLCALMMLITVNHP